MTMRLKGGSFEVEVEVKMGSDTSTGVDAVDMHYASRSRLMRTDLKIFTSRGHVLKGNLFVRNHLDESRKVYLSSNKRTTLSISVHQILYLKRSAADFEPSNATFAQQA